MSSETTRIPANTRDLRPQVLDEHGRMRILPASFWAAATRNERAMFGHLHGAYLFPTTELVARLRELISGLKAVEIGAGTGVLAQALGITATDSFQQQDPKYRKIYAMLGQPTIPYGANVAKATAEQALRMYKPDVVLAAWVTQRWNPDRPMLDSNEAGVDEEAVIKSCRRYLFVGNEKVHAEKVIWALPHTIEYPDFVFSRASNGSRDFIAVFDGAQA